MAAPLTSIQLLSDLHLEFLGDEDFHGTTKEWAVAVHNIPVLAPVLVLCGDIGIIRKKGDLRESQYEAFLRHVASKWESVVVVAGNHEYYGCAIDDVDTRTREFCAALANVHYLQKSTIDIRGIRFIGATLWARLPGAAHRFYESIVNDYYQISIADTESADGTNERLLTVEDTNALHDDHLAYIAAQVDACERSEMPCVVVTHHAPITKNVHAADSRERGPMSLYQTNGRNLTEIVAGKPAAKAWVYGHTHWSSSQVHGTCRFVSNQLGYADKNDSDGVYKGDYVLRLDAEHDDQEFATRGHYE